MEQPLKLTCKIPAACNIVPSVNKDKILSYHTEKRLL